MTITLKDLALEMPEVGITLGGAAVTARPLTLRRATAIGNARPLPERPRDAREDPQWEPAFNIAFTKRMICEIAAAIDYRTAAGLRFDPGGSPKDVSRWCDAVIEELYDRLPEAEVTRAYRAIAGACTVEARIEVAQGNSSAPAEEGGGEERD